MKSKPSGLCPPAWHVVDAEVEPRLQTCQVPAGDLGQVIQFAHQESGRNSSPHLSGFSRGSGDTWYSVPPGLGTD